MLSAAAVRQERLLLLRKSRRNTPFFTTLRLQSTKNSNPEITKDEKLSHAGIHFSTTINNSKNINVQVDLEENDENWASPSISVLNKKLQELQSKPVDFHYYLRSLHKIKNGDELPYKFGINQLHSKHRENSTMDDILKGILKRFDESTTDYAFGYGSKVFSQGSSVDISNSQIDMICAVSNPLDWHAKNIVRNGSDYSFLKYLGPSAINYVQQLGAGIYFNPFVDIKINDTQLELKYGITSTDTLIDDLTNWSTMYLSGRLHKPVAIVQNNPQLLFLNQYNLANAVKLSLLLLNKQEIKESELYLTIAGLSYMGDPRLKVKGENPDKVKNIVENQFELFKDLYKPLLQNYFPEIVQRIDGEECTDQLYKVNLSEEQMANIIIELPRQFRSRIFNLLKDKYANELSRDDLAQNIIRNPSIKVTTIKPSQKPLLSYNDLSSISVSNPLSDIPSYDWEYLPTSYKVENSPFVKKMVADFKSNPFELRGVISQTIEDTVGSSALLQSVKGILTAGLVRSYKYALAKRNKYLQAQAKKGK